MALSPKRVEVNLPAGKAISRQDRQKWVHWCHNEIYAKGRSDFAVLEDLIANALIPSITYSGCHKYIRSAHNLGKETLLRWSQETLNMYRSRCIAMLDKAEATGDVAVLIKALNSVGDNLNMAELSVNSQKIELPELLGDDDDTTTPSNQAVTFNFPEATKKDVEDLKDK